MNVEGVSYSVDLSKRTASLVKCISLTTTDVVIPDSVEYNAVKFPVETICESAYYGTSITSLSIPSTVTYIEKDAFYACSSLYSVELRDGDSLLTFAPSSLSCFGQPSGVTSNFTQLKLGRNIYFTNANPFAYQRKLKYVEVGPCVSSIPALAFSNDSSLDSIYISNNVKEIGELAFDCCSSLRVLAGLDSNDYISYIRSYAFRGCSSLKSIILPKHLSVIGDHAFTACESLQQISIPASVDTIMYCAFDGCLSLRNLIIEDGVNSLFIDNEADGGCFNLCPLEYIYFGRNITKKYTSPFPFAERPSIKHVAFSNSVTTIDNSLLCRSTSLEELTIPASVTKIGSYAFDGCTSLRSVTFEPSPSPVTLNNAYTTGFDDANIDDLYLCRPIILTNQYGSPFAHGAMLKNVYLSDYAGNFQSGFFDENTSIHNVYLNTDVSLRSGTVLFDNLDGIENLYVGDKVTNIPPKMFCDCTHLTHVYSEAVTPPTLASDNFSKQELIVKVPDYCANSYKLVESWYNAGKNYIYCDNDFEFSISSDDFVDWVLNCDTLDRVSRLTLTGDVSSDDVWTTLKKLTHLSYLDMSNAVCTSIPSNQFAHSLLYTFVPPATLSSIGNNAFQGCVNLQADFNFASGEVSIGDYAFDGCSKMANTFAFSPDVVYVKIGQCAFRNCPNFGGTFTLSSRFDIGANAFENCLKLTSVVFASSVSDTTPSTFGDFAFMNTGITQMTLPAYVEKLPLALWRGCDALSSVKFLNEDMGFTVTNTGILNNDGSLYQILPAKIGPDYSIPSSIRSIGAYAFADLQSLESIEILESVDAIGAGAFANCENLKDVTLYINNLRYSPLSIPASTFSGIHAQAALYLNIGDRTRVPQTVKAYNQATGWSVFSNIDSPAAQYNVKVKPSDYGKVSALPRVAAAGETVTLSVTPNEGYVFVRYLLDGATLKTANTFVMPANDVTVDAEFKSSEPDFYHIIVDSCANGNVEVSEQAAPDSEVSITFVPVEGYTLQSWTLNGEVQSITAIKFTMPHKDVVIAAAFAKIQSALTIDSINTEGTIQAFINNDTVQGTSVKVNWHDEVKLEAQPSVGYQFVMWNIGSSDSLVVDSLKNPITFLMPASDVSVSATFEKMTFSVAVDSTIVNGSVVAMPQIASPGDTVALTIQPEQDYMLTSWTAGEGVTQLGDSAFIMPLGDVIVTATFERVKHHVIVSDSIMNGSVEVMPSSVAVYGDTIVVKANPESELYYFTRWTIIDSNGVELALLPLEGDSTSFVMPTCDVHVSAQFEQYVFLITNVAENGNIHSEDSAVPTDTVPVTIVPAFDYELVNWSAGDDVTLVGDSAFVMPFHDVELTASFTRIRHHVVVSDSIENGTVIVSPDASAFVYGDTIKLVAETSDLYDFAGWQIEGLSETVSDSSAISFVMPTNDVYVSASFVKKIFAIKAISSEGGMIVVDSMASPRDTVRIELIPMDDYRLVEWSAGDDVVLLGDSAFVMPFNEVTLSASFVRLEHQVKADAQGQGTIVEGYATEAVFGDTITIVAKPDDGYRFDGWVSDDLADLPADSILTFSMPANDVHVTAIFKVITYAIIKSDEMLGGTFEVMGGYDEAAAGDTIVLCAMADLGYDFDGWEIEGAEITYPLATTSFVMPAHPVTVKAIFKDATRISSLATDWSVVLAENEIRVEGLQGSETVMVTSAAGALVFEAIGNSGSVHISTIDIESGTYILRVNQSIYKLFIH